MDLDRLRYLVPATIVVAALWALTIVQWVEVFTEEPPAPPVIQEIGTRTSTRPVLRPTEAAYTPTPTRKPQKRRSTPVQTTQAVRTASPTPSPTATRSIPAATSPTSVPTAVTSDPTPTDETSAPGVGSEPEVAPEAIPEN